MLLSGRVCCITSAAKTKAMVTFIIPGTKNELVNEDNLIVVAAEGRGCYFYVITNALKKEWKKIYSSYNLGHYKKQVGESNLFDAHRKYLVNMKQVIGFDHKYILELKIYIDKEVQVAKRKTTAFRKKLNNLR